MTVNEKTEAICQVFHVVKVSIIASACSGTSLCYIENHTTMWRDLQILTLTYTRKLCCITCILLIYCVLYVILLYFYGLQLDNLHDWQ